MNQTKIIKMINKYTVLGMSCQGCKKTIEKIISSIKGVSEVNVDLEGKSVQIESQNKIPLKTLQKSFEDSHYNIEDFTEKHKSCCGAKPKIKKVENGSGIFYCPMHCEGDKTYTKMGFCKICGMDLLERESSEGNNLEKKNYRKQLKKLYISILFTLPVFFISMSDLLGGKNIFSKLASQQFWNYMQFVLALPVVFYTCRDYFIRAFKSFFTFHLNMFTLVGIGTGVAFVYSVVGLFFPEIFPHQFKSIEGNVHMYFEATTVILTLVLFGQVLESKAHSQTGGAIKDLMQLQPSQAIKIEKGIEKTISIKEVKIGDILRIKPGDKIPVDGILIEGNAYIDESLITGEPLTVEKTMDSKLNTGTINGDTSFLMKAQKIGADTLLAQIIEMVNNASFSRAPIQKLTETISRYFVPIVIFISIVTFLIWNFYGPEPSFSYAFVNAIAILIIACPCALGLATPMSIMVGIGKAAKKGILIKDAETLEAMNKVNVLITDKTGTLTEGKATVNKIFVIGGEYDKNKVLQFAASINNHSEHPLAKAILTFAKVRNIKLLEVKDFKNITGNGVQGSISGKSVKIGNDEFIKKGEFENDEFDENIKQEQKNGNTIAYISIDKKLVGAISIHDSIRETSKNAIDYLSKNNIEVMMMTGDNINTATSVANTLNIKNYKAQCLPQDKLDKIKALQSQGKIVAMVGDGINDSPALTQANVGIAMGTGSGIAVKSANITLVKSDLMSLVEAKKLSHQVVANIKQNLFFAFIYNLLGVPIAAGVLYPIYGILLSPMIAALAMSLSSVSVIANSLRLKAK